ncbi:MAG: Mu-like prophage major head subunit gpT family protein [Burkholderiaceae bacterium]
MQINAANLKTLNIAFNAAFKDGQGQAASLYTQLATVVPSTTGAEEYAWLGQMPNMREWIGDRVVHGIAAHGYTIKNKPFELTIAVPRAAIEDDRYGVYSPMFTEMGRAVEAHPDQLIFDLLKDGDAELCYDGTPFFSAAHPVLNRSGKAGVQSNVLDTSSSPGPRWFVLDTSRALKPLIYQNRKAPNFVAKDKETDDNVFDRAEFRYGTDRRGNAGFGFWQMAQSSNKPLTEASLAEAITAMTARTGDHGRALGIMGTTLVVPPALEFKARELLTNDLVAVDGGGTKNNPLKGRLQLMVAPLLT